MYARVFVSALKTPAMEFDYSRYARVIAAQSSSASSLRQQPEKHGNIHKKTPAIKPDFFTEHKIADACA